MDSLSQKGEGLFTGLLAFPGTHDALRAERTAKEAGMDARLVHNPRTLSNECGYALEIRACAAMELRELIEMGRFRVSGVHRTPPGGAGSNPLRFP